MLNAQELKEKMDGKDIEKLLNLLGASISEVNEEEIICNTICHHGSKQKLYYYKNSKLFKCYTDCGDNFDILELVCRHKEYTFLEAIRWICIQLGFSTSPQGFGEQLDRINDWDFINQIRKRKTKKDQKSYDYYDRSILNIFQKMYLKEWINEGIDINTLNTYEILYSTLQQKIVIPHYDHKNRLMGVRTRATNEEEIEIYGKYTPFQINNMIYSHPISQNLYGLNINENTIRRKKKVMLVEGEKSVLQCDSMFGNENFTVALCGSNLSNFQRDLIVSLGVNEVIIALDKQYESVQCDSGNRWAKHIREKIINKLAPYCVTSVLWDTENILPFKASPTDIGKDTLLKLMENKIYAGCIV